MSRESRVSESTLALAVTMLVMVPAGSRGQELGSLKRVSVPQPSEVAKYVSNTSMLVALGKSFFWDMQVGSDSRMACATCHFHAGADHRARNQLVNSLDAFPVNYQLSAEDFPFHLLSNPANNRSAVVRDSAAVVGSAGLFRRAFQDVTPGSGGEDGFDTGDTPAFSISGIHTRRVTPRNAPTVINAVFNVRNFWDGRARSVFTGRTPFGEADPGLHSLLLRDGRLTLERVRVDNASLASQAVAPPVNNVEMTYDGRTWLKIGKKMLSLRPLALQRVAADDSVLGELANGTGRGLHPSLTYLGMVQAVFKPEYWNSTQLVDREGRELGRVAPAQSTSEFTQAEFNFALFWGLAIQAYESTFVSDDSRFDRFSEGSADALTDQERRGLQLFRGQGGCTNCHVGPELTTASFTSIARRGLTQGGQNIPARDTGFLRIGVRPIAEDLGLGADDDFGQPLSVAAALRAAARNSVRGTFKTPTLRNVELTGPYFHNGGQATLDQVVAFYNRGGDFPGDGNLGPGIRQRNLNAGERQALVAFLRSLTDDRVRFERAPFDHPELCVPVGHEELAPQTLRVDGRDGRFPLSAADRWVGLPAVGRSGNLVPLQTFEELLAGIGGDGSRAHAQSAACTIP